MSDKEAYAQGYNAYSDCVGIFENPYDPIENEAAHTSWENGWQDASYDEWYDWY